MFRKTYDVFIAYHGSYGNGTKEISSRLNDFLLEHGLTTFYFPLFDGDNYIANITKAISSNTFILVCNENINTTSSGKIDSAKHFALLTEIESFYALTKSNDGVEFEDAKVLVCGDYMEKRKKGQEALLHELFANRTHFYLNSEAEKDTFNTVLEWINDRLEKQANKWRRTQMSLEVSMVFVERDEMGSRIELSDHLAKSKSIFAIGISNVAIVELYRQALKHAIVENNAKVELIFLDPNSKYTKAREKDEFGSCNDIIKNLTSASIGRMQHFKEELKELKNKCKIYTYDKLPRLNLIILEDCAIIQYYTDKQSGGKSPCFFIERQKRVSPMYDYCVKIFNDVKSTAKEI